MVVLQYENLLLHQVDDGVLAVIGEDNKTPHTSITPPFDVIQSLVSNYPKLRDLPVPIAGLMDRLVTLDLANCSSITKIPSAYGQLGTVQNLNVSGTKLSAIPATMLPSLKTLDVSCCRRLTNVGDVPNLVVLNCTNSAIVDISIATLQTLRQLFAFHTKLSVIAHAASLEVMAWSPAMTGTLTIADTPNLLSVLTTSTRESIHIDPGCEAIVQIVGGVRDG